jgi:hypothetical protein
MNDNEKDYVRTIIRDMERQYTCEASGVADTLSTFAENEGITTEDLIETAKSISGWTTYFINEVYSKRKEGSIHE